MINSCPFLVNSLLEMTSRFKSVEHQLVHIRVRTSLGVVRAFLNISESGHIEFLVFQDTETEVDQVQVPVQIQGHWPQHGSITFVDYRMRYRKNSPMVLRGLQLHIRGGEKVGVVGRTGSGENPFSDLWSVSTRPLTTGRKGDVLGSS